MWEHATASLSSMSHVRSEALKQDFPIWTSSCAMSLLVAQNSKNLLLVALHFKKRQVPEAPAFWVFRVRVCYGDLGPGS